MVINILFFDLRPIYIAFFGDGLHGDRGYPALPYCFIRRHPVVEVVLEF